MASLREQTAVLCEEMLQSISSNFDYEGTTDVFWDDQRTVTQDDERVFLDEDGEEYLGKRVAADPAAGGR